jgi:cytochrome c biogenesis protein CcmG/thiol:disulfide interchange protein DsbE
MTLRQQWLVVAVIVAVVGVALSVGAYVMHDQLFPVEVGSTAPGFSARRVDGSQRVQTMADYRNKVLVLNIWATWCPPCVVEMPTIERLRQQVPDSDLKIVAVSIDDYVGADSVRAFGKNLKLSFEILLDSLHRIDRDYLTTGYPETFVIARDGTIRKKWIGPDNWASDANVALVRELLGPVPAPASGLADSGLAVPLKKP